MTLYPNFDPRLQRQGPEPDTTHWRLLKRAGLQVITEDMRWLSDEFAKQIQKELDSDLLEKLFEQYQP